MYIAFERMSDGGQGEPHPLLVATLCNHGALLERVKGDLDGAESLYKQALAIKPDDSATLYNYAVRCHPRREVICYVAAADLSALSQVLLEDGRRDDASALALYQRAIEADPEDENALNNCALLLQNRLGHYGPAQEMFERAVTAAPSRVDILCNYGLFLEDVRLDAEGAKGAYEKALEDDEDDVVALCNLGGLLLRTGDAKGAEARFRQAREVDEESAVPLIEMRREAAAKAPIASG